MGRAGILLWFGLRLFADPLDEAARALSKKVAGHLSPSETARITARNLSNLPDAELSRLRSAVERAVRKPRATAAIEVSLTLSQNNREHLAIAEIQKFDGRVVEMAAFRAESLARPAIEKRRMWEQETAILDVVSMAGKLAVLDRTGASLYDESRQRIAFQPVPETPRDPRGRLAVREDGIEVHLPGFACSGNWQDLPCAASESTWETAGKQVRLTAERNTFEAAGLPAFFSAAQLREGAALSLESGKLALVDRDGAVVSEIEGSGDAIAGVCGGARLLAGGMSAVWLYDVAAGKLSGALAKTDFAGPVMELRPQEGGAIAIVREAQRYAAYHLSVPCGR